MHYLHSALSRPPSWPWCGQMRSGRSRASLPYLETLLGGGGGWRGAEDMVVESAEVIVTDEYMSPMTTYLLMHQNFKSWNCEFQIQKLKPPPPPPFLPSFPSRTLSVPQSPPDIAALCSKLVGNIVLSALHSTIQAVTHDTHTLDITKKKFHPSFLFYGRQLQIRVEQWWIWLPSLLPPCTTFFVR